jgi:hypothetical protein
MGAPGQTVIRGPSFLRFANAPFVLALVQLPLLVVPAALLLLLAPVLLLVAVMLISISYFRGRRRCDADTDVLALVAAKTSGIKGNRRGSPQIWRSSGSFCQVGGGISVSV